MNIDFMNIDLNDYRAFVKAVTSDPSLDLEKLIARLRELQDLNLANIPLLSTAGTGLASEGGEFNEIIKKILYQGKPLNEDNIFHLKRELGDIIFYWTNACTALKLDPNEVIRENINKLSARYPNGFEIAKSENRKSNDL